MSLSPIARAAPSPQTFYSRETNDKYKIDFIRRLQWFLENTDRETYNNLTDCYGLSNIYVQFFVIKHGSPYDMNDKSAWNTQPSRSPVYHDLAKEYHDDFITFFDRVSPATIREAVIRNRPKLFDEGYRCVLWTALSTGNGEVKWYLADSEIELLTAMMVWPIARILVQQVGPDKYPMQMGNVLSVDQHAFLEQNRDWKSFPLVLSRASSSDDEEQSSEEAGSELGQTLSTCSTLRSDTWEVGDTD